MPHNKKDSKQLFTFIIWLITAWTLGLIFFTSYIPKNPTDLSCPATNDNTAIVILSGSNGRIEQGIKLLKECKSIKHMLISGVNNTISSNNILQSIKIPNELKNRISLGRLARDTHSNVEETLIWAKLKKLNNIILITSNYHMPRSLLEFKFFAPDLKVTPYPCVKYTNNDNMPLEINHIKQIFMEYNKYLFLTLKIGWLKWLNLFS